jgi:MFS superfamily sulfate permease-like transporter
VALGVVVAGVVAALVTVAVALGVVVAGVVVAVVLAVVGVAGRVGVFLGRRSVVDDHVDGRRVDTVLRGFADPVLDVECVLDGREDVGVGARSHERAQEHVAACAGPAVEGERGHTSGSGGRREKACGDVCDRAG